jgi:hypothetical protein
VTENGSIIITLAEAERLLHAGRNSIIESPWVQHFTRRRGDEPAEECVLLPREWVQDAGLSDSPELAL